MVYRRQTTRDVLVGLLIIAALTMLCANAHTVLDVSHGAPPDPKDVVREYRTAEVLNEYGVFVSKISDTLIKGDFEGARTAIAAYERRFAGKLPTGADTWDVYQHLMRIAYERHKYAAVLWLAEKSPLALAEDPNNASHTGAFTYYYLALWKTRGLDAAEEAYRLGVENSRNHQGGWRIRAQLRTGWIETQVAAGKLDRAAAKQELAVEALACEYRLSLAENGAYITLVSVCLTDKDYDCLRRVALQSLFTSDKNKLNHLWNSTLKPLWTLDGLGPEHLIALTNEYLADCEDPQARVRAAFFQATMHRLQAAILYESVMRSDEADKLFAADNDLRFSIVRQAWTKDSPLETIAVSGEPAPGNSLSQQAARYLSNLAPGSPVRRWPMGPASEELRDRVRQRALERMREGEPSAPPRPPGVPPEAAPGNAP